MEGQRQFLFLFLRFFKLRLKNCPKMVMGVLWEFCFLKREKGKVIKKNKQKPNQPNF